MTTQIQNSIPADVEAKCLEAAWAAHRAWDVPFPGDSLETQRWYAKMAFDNVLAYEREKWLRDNA